MKNLIFSKNITSLQYIFLFNVFILNYILINSYVSVHGYARFLNFYFMYTYTYDLFKLWDYFIKSAIASKLLDRFGKFFLKYNIHFNILRFSTPNIMRFFKFVQYFESNIEWMKNYNTFFSKWIKINIHLKLTIIKMILKYLQCLLFSAATWCGVCARIPNSIRNIKIHFVEIDDDRKLLPHQVLLKLLAIVATAVTKEQQCCNQDLVMWQETVPAAPGVVDAVVLVRRLEEKNVEGTSAVGSATVVLFK